MQFVHVVISINTWTMTVFYSQSEARSLWSVPWRLHCWLSGDCLLYYSGLLKHLLYPIHIVFLHYLGLLLNTLKALADWCIGICFLYSICLLCLPEFRLSLHEAQSSSEIQAPVNKAVRAECVMTRALKSGTAHDGLLLHSQRRTWKRRNKNLPRLLIYARPMKCALAVKCILFEKVFVSFIIH